jgi:uncharacterized protein YbjT (DUF2867 family)
MKVMVVGAGGFIGRHVMRALSVAGHDAQALRPEWVQAHRSSWWRTALCGADAAVYVAGTLGDQGGGHAGWLDRMHHLAPLALLQAGVPRLVHVSALCGGRSPYARSKRRGDEALLAEARCSGQTLHVVRPSLVLGPGGRSSRQLARWAQWPWLPLPRALQHCRVQPLRVEDLAPALVGLLSEADDRANGGPLSAVGPHIDTLAAWLSQRRVADGRCAPAFATLPDALSGASAAVGDALGIAAWNRPLWDLLQHDSIEPDRDRSAWLPTLLGRPLCNVTEGAW